MAKSFIFLAAALCFLSVLGGAYGKDSHFFVEGKVYCDTCRAQFLNRLTEYMPGATVRLECRDREDGELSYSIEGTTNEKGIYSLKVDGDHAEEICDVFLVKSNRPDCQEIPSEPYTRKNARVGLTSDNGLATPVRRANPLGFLKSKPLAECVQVFKELGITPESLKIQKF